MEGTTIFDSRGRHLWISQEPPELAGNLIGLPVTENIVEADHVALAAAFFTASLEQRPVELTVTTERGGVRHWDCTLERLEDAEYVLLWRQQRPRIPLTPREREILAAVLRDEIGKVTARKLGINRHTVESFRRILRLKSGTTGPATLALWAARNGIIVP